MLDRPNKTLADYVVIALCPVLIMALVGSLVFFLLAIGYTGAFEDRVRWALFWFVLGSVLVSRIAIERGAAHAAVYALGLAFATGVFINRFLGFHLLVWGLLAVIWWATHKLTWDCTLIDDDEDASGEGLLQAAGLTDQPREPAPAATPKALAERLRPKRPPVRIAWWERVFKNRAPGEGRAHAPGLWVVYFSLAALPLFGLGQAMLAAEDAARRRAAFLFLCVYVGAALGLLLCTSFLGLRRYLRQRRLQMPPLMAGSWLTLGVVLAGLVLLACVLLPRPDAAWSVTALAERLGAQPQRASTNAVLSGEAAKGEGTRLGTSKDQGTEKGPLKKEGAPSQPGGKQGETGGEGKQEGQQGKADAGAKKTGPGQAATPQRPAENPPQNPSQNPAANPPPKPGPVEISAALGQWLKWLLYALFALFVCWQAWRNRRAIAAVLRQLWREWLALWNRLFPRARPATATIAGAVAGPSARARRFATFTNPFTSGTAERTPPEELVRLTFEALQAWAGEHGAGRAPEQTPLEFAAALGERVPTMAGETHEVAQHYACWAYADKAPPPECLAALERLWRQMEELGDLPLPVVAPEAGAER